MTATAAILSGALVLLPLALFQIPDEVPSAKALGSVAALGIAGTAVASIVLYRMLVAYGSARTTLVTYLLPPFALFYGVVFLDERITLHALLGPDPHPERRRARRRSPALAGDADPRPRCTAP